MLMLVLYGFLEVTSYNPEVKRLDTIDPSCRTSTGVVCGLSFFPVYISQYLSAVNAHFNVGPTFYGPPPRRHKTRVDYVGVPTATLHSVQRCHAQYSAADRLQLISDIAKRDHLPLQIDIEVGLFYEHSPATAKFAWDKTRLVENALRGTGREYGILVSAR